MTYSLVWMPQVLRSAGLKVALVDGWEEGRAALTLESKPDCLER